MSYSPKELVEIAGKFERIAQVALEKRAKFTEEEDDMYDTWLMGVKQSLERKGLSIMDFDQQQLEKAYDRWRSSQELLEMKQERGQKEHDRWGKEKKEVRPGESVYEMLRPEHFDANDAFAKLDDVLFGNLSSFGKKKDKKKLDPKDKASNKSSKAPDKKDNKKSKTSKKSSEYYDNLLRKFAEPPVIDQQFPTSYNDQRSQLEKSTTGEYFPIKDLPGDIKAALNEIVQQGGNINEPQMGPLGKRYAQNISQAITGTTVNLDYLAKQVQLMYNVFNGSSNPNMANKARTTYQKLTLLKGQVMGQPQSQSPNKPGGGNAPGPGAGKGGFGGNSGPGGATSGKPGAGGQSGVGSRLIKPFDYRKDNEFVNHIHAATDWMGANPAMTSYMKMFNKIKDNLDGNKSSDEMYKYLQEALGYTGDEATGARIKAARKYMLDRYGPNSGKWQASSPYTAPMNTGTPTNTVAPIEPSPGWNTQKPEQDIF